MHDAAYHRKAAMGTGESGPVIGADLIRSLTNDFTALWESCPATLPEYDSWFTHSRQRAYSGEITSFIDELQSKGFHSPQDPGIRRTAQTMIYRMLEIDSDSSAVRLLDTFGTCGDSFTGQARAFDPQMNEKDLYQALRNVWIFNSLQMWSGIPVSCTPSCLAYSLLYPYTDNILDNSSLGHNEKKRFNRLLGRRLEGIADPGFAGEYHNIERCIRLIEEEFPRNSFPHVYHSILAIHHAQTESLRLQHSADPAIITGITITKGGTSVLADGSLVSGQLDPVLIKFCFDFGAVLQLVDDLQDAAEDRKAGHATMFSTLMSRNEFESLTSRLLQCIHLFLGSAHWPSGTGAVLRECFLKGCWRLVLESIARQQEYYSAEYVKAIEPHSPISFADLMKLRTRLKNAYRQADRTHIRQVLQSSGIQEQIKWSAK